jgi:ATP-dependent exoDNAse (exonuclease V) alpha subunit
MYHLSIKLVSRSTGRSATAASAYRAGEKIHDERTNTTHDYTRKQGVVHEEILTPEESPEWAKDREKLWNAAELAEKRKDSRVAREYEIAIPKELSKEEGIELVMEFGKELSDRYGVAVDVAVHKDHKKDWQGKEKGFDSYHAHLLSTTRLLGKEGLGEKAALELSDSKRKSLGLCKGSEEIETVRKMWEQTANRALERSGHRERIDCRSLKEQGIEREPTRHLGSKATYLERSGTQTEIGDVNRQIEQAYEQGLKDREDLMLMNQKLIELDTDIKKALKEREKVSELSKKMERGADRFVEKYEAMQREAKQRERDREREFHRQRSYELER